MVSMAGYIGGKRGKQNRSYQSQMDHRERTAVNAELIRGFNGWKSGQPLWATTLGIYSEC